MPLIGRTGTPGIPAPPSPPIYAHWHLNGDMIDSSGNGRNGTPVGSPSWVAGLLNQCMRVSLGNYASFGNIADFDQYNPFSVEAWINVASAGPRIISHTTTGQNVGWQICVDGASGKIIVILWNTSAKYIMVLGDTVVTSGTWRHIFVTYSGSSTAAGVKIYVDGVLNANTVYKDTLTASMSNAGNCLLQYENGGDIDETLIYSGVATQEYITWRYNGGAGRENTS